MNNDGMSIITVKRKTESMRISRNKEEFDVYTEEKWVHQMGFYKYPRVVVDEGKNQETELTARIGKYTQNFMRMYPLLK